MNGKIRTIAFYLPQFHPVEENNRWWSPGFTEWTNVAQARPLFKGHYQPHVPRETGFYDLRLEETRTYQAELAQKYGLGGFCYYHYWFSGKQLLQRPLAEVVSTGRPDLPFCLCWANENWTRAWDGRERDMLIEQTYSEQDAIEHGRWLAELFKDSRYIKVDGRPLFLIYRPDKVGFLNELKASINEHCNRLGLKSVYIVAVKNAFVKNTDQEMLDWGFDALVDFQPNAADFPAPRGVKQHIYRLLKKYLPDTLYQWLKTRASAVNQVDYANYVMAKTAKNWPHDYIRWPCVFPSWDNTARRKTPTIIQNESPEVYGKWLEYAFECVATYPMGERFVFINAWNEWAEGCHLEPDLKHGDAFLQQTHKAIRDVGIEHA